MTQALHILRKDLHHQRIDLTLYAVLLLFLYWLVPTGWPGRWSSTTAPQLVLGLLQFAVPILWLVLITRLIHEEPLTGNRQFWTTRPYRWSSLLTAKLLFIALFIALPFVLMQCALLMHAGLSPFQQLQTVAVAKVLLITWAPMMLIAAVTSTLASSIFTLLSLAIIWLVFIATTVGRNARLADAPSKHLVEGVLFALIFGCILPLLYKKRAVKLSRIVLAASVILFLVTTEVALRPTPHMPGTALLEAHYPPNAAPELHLNYNASLPHTAHRDADTDADLREVTLPIKLDGLTAGARLQDPLVQFQVEREGYRYTSPWRPVHLNTGGMQLLVPSATLAHAGHAPSHVSITMAAEEIRPSETQTVKIQDRFHIPGGGSCTATNPPYEGRSPETAVVCHFAFSFAQRIEIQRNFDAGCRRAENPPQVISPFEPGASLDPIAHWPIDPAWARANIPPAQRCTMQSLTTTVYRPVTSFRTSLDIPSIRLADNIDQ